MPHLGMRPIIIAVLLASAVWQTSAAGGWFSDLFANPLTGVQQRLQQQQHRRLTQLSISVDSESAEFVGRRLQQLEQQQQAEQQGSYGYGSYGYGYGYGYSGYGYSAETAADTGASGSSRSLLAVSSNLAPTLVYDEPEHVSHRVLAGLDHHDFIEISEDTAAAISNDFLELPSEQRAARKLLMANSDIPKVAVAVEEPIALQPVDELLSTATRALLQEETAGGYGSYGEYGYGYSYGYGYGYGADSTTESGTGRSLLDAAETDDVQLYNLWLQQYNAKHHAH